SIVSESWLNNFQQMQQTVLEVQHFPKPYSIKLADNDTIIELNASVRLTISFHLYAQLNLKNREFFIVHEQIEQPIIGFSELSELGIDPVSTLERLAYTPEEEVEEEIEAETEEIEYSSETGSLDEAIQKMLARAKANGMPIVWWKKLCKLVK